MLTHCLRERKNRVEISVAFLLITSFYSYSNLLTQRK